MVTAACIHGGVAVGSLRASRAGTRPRLRAHEVRDAYFLHWLGVEYATGETGRARRLLGVLGTSRANPNTGFAL